MQRAETRVAYKLYGLCDKFQLLNTSIVLGYRLIKHGCFQRKCSIPSDLMLLPDILQFHHVHHALHLVRLHHRVHLAVHSHTYLLRFHR